MNFDNIFILGNSTDWLEQSLRGFNSYNNICLINEKILVNGNLKKKIVNLHYSHRLNKFVNIPYKSMWYTTFVQYINDKKTISNNSIIIFYDRNRFCHDFRFLAYLRKKYPQIKLVYIFTNIIEYSGAKELNYLEHIADWYDVVFAFDPEDAKKYGFSYSPLIYDVDSDYKKEEKENKENLVFYVGKAKDRLKGLLLYFEKLKKVGIKTDFHIVNVKEEDFKYSDEIIYNKFMTYAECVDHIQKATCLIDVIQGKSSGLTIKICEAICYDKKLITTNKNVVNYPFYDSRYIKVVESPEDIDESFFVENMDVHYSKDDKAYFSASNFLIRLINELEDKNG